MTRIIIEHPGLLSTVQDMGRFGYQRYGMPAAGAMDAYSLQLANLLSGNPSDAAGIEATLVGPKILFTGPCVVAMCGSGMRPLFNGEPAPLYRTLAADRGDRLGFRAAETGCRMYIAFAGGLDVPPLMGSRSTYTLGRIGGFNGRALNEGDVIGLGKAKESRPVGDLPAALVPDYETKRPIRIIPGPESKRLSTAGLGALLNNEYKVSGQSDRMGYRLQGKSVKLKEPGAEIISAGIAAGTVQIPGNGQPIIMMADRQTTGGYARIAAIASVDLGRVAQLRPGDGLFFSEIELEQARSLFLDRQRAVRRLLG